ncbi:MAG: hypothetical protein WC205_04195 [Opitutaceae bacterium]|jgi:hypothetical protein
MNDYKLKFYIERRACELGRLALYIRGRSHGGDDGVTRVRAQPVVFTAVTRETAGQVEMSPTMMLSPEDGQALMDELWCAGLRPTEGTGSAGSLAATERHLADMRALVFKTKPDA